MSERPKVNSKGQQELDKAQEQFDSFHNQIKEMTVDKANEAPLADFEPQTKMSNREIAKSNVLYLKPKRSFRPHEKFNEKYRKDWEHAKQYVTFIAENYEVRGESIDLWVKMFPGTPCEEWDVPVNKPVAAPRYVAERIANCRYHYLTTEEGTTTGMDNYGTYTGQLVAKQTKQRLDARPAGNAFVAMGS